MNAFSTFLNSMDWQGLFEFLMTMCAALLCLTVHELSHGLVAYKLGDPTAKNGGRLTLNPIKHIDIFGFAMMLVAGVGWAKAVPVDPRQFKNPKRDMALTALAGPISNFILALLVAGILSLLYSSQGLIETMIKFWGVDGLVLVLSFMASLVVMNVGLGIFNLFPIPPLDGSKVLFSVLPPKVYWAILRCERYVMGALILLLWLGVFDGPLHWLIDQGLYIVGMITRCPLFL